MRLSLVVLWGIVGWWCITGWRRAYIPPPPLDIPERPPRPNWLLLGLIGVVGGVIGGSVFTVTFGPQPEPWLTFGPSPEPWMRVVFAAATTVGAFLGASLLTDLYGMAKGNKNVTRG